VLFTASMIECTSRVLWLMIDMADIWGKEKEKEEQKEEEQERSKSAAGERSACFVEQDYSSVCWLDCTSEGISRSIR